MKMMGVLRLSLSVNVAEKIAPHFDDAFFDIIDHKHTHYCFKGGRGSTKSSFVSDVIPILLMKNKDIHAVVCRKVGNTLKGSVYNQIIWSIDDLGLSEFFKVYKSPLKIVYKPTGQEIIFFGCDDSTKSKGIKPPFGRIGIVWYEEVDQFTGMNEIRTMNQSFIRNEGDNWVFYTFNPPKSKDNWANHEFDMTRDDRLVHHSTYLTVPKEWLGSQFFIEAEYLKRTNEDAYRHEYMGEAIGTGGNVFNNVIKCKITDEEIQEFDKLYYGVDFGFAVDPFSFGKFYYHNNKLWVLDEIYEVGLSNKKAYDKIIKKNVGNEPIFCDSAEPKSISELKSYGLNAQKCKKGADSVNFGMKWLQNLEAIYIDPDKTPNAYKEFISYEYAMNKDGEYISKYPDLNNHFIDATRYAMRDMMKSRTIKHTGRRL